MSDLISKCTEAFPEMLDHFSEAELSRAGDFGAYIFFEDYFNDFVECRKDKDLLLQRAAAFIEELAGSPDESTRNLAEIGILEGLVNRGVVEISPFLGSNSKALLVTASSRTRIDLPAWRLKEKRGE